MFKPRLRRVLVLVFVAAFFAAAGSAHAATATKVTVMTQNVDAGIDLGRLISTPPAQFNQVAGKLFEGVGADDPNGRMQAIADEIAKLKPDIVGLQEVPLYRTGPAPASTIAFDFLATIRAELASKHAPYRLATVKQPFDLEFPTDRGYDVRLTFGDAVLTRKGVKVRHARSRDFKAEQRIQTQAIGVMARPRGWNELDATVRGVSFHLVNTHLEPRDTTIRDAQARELVKGPLHSRLPTILLGDLNSAASQSDAAQRQAYRVIAGAGFKDMGTRRFTCCRIDLTGDAGLDYTGDHVMAKGKIRRLRTRVIGSERTPAGFHPSDHEGVVSVLKIRR